LTLSPPSSTISRSPSLGSVCSPVQTDFTSEFGHASHTSRGPSPLRHETRPLLGGSDTSRCLTHNSDVASGKGGLATLPNSENSYICLWGTNGVCDGGEFLTREALNHHVKLEHLLECPISGCTEKVFENRDLLACHMRSDHTGSITANATSYRASNLLEPAAPDEARSAPLGERAVASTRNLVEDRMLKMEMSIGISKKRCRDQLRTVLEKRLWRANGKS
jgi:DNA polymerase epsilon subunit 1